ncbi:MAG: hypothetical protein QGD89_05240 [Actinomycetota bacterium]|nr:hypothetical protein [Actinomycetota bacterium]
MFTRLRWFVFGSAATLGATVVVVSRARTLRERLTPEGVARASASLLADAIESIGDRLQRSAVRQSSDAPRPDAS